MLFVLALFIFSTILNLSGSKYPVPLKKYIRIDTSRQKSITYGAQPPGSSRMIEYRRPDVIFFTKRAHAVPALV